MRHRIKKTVTIKTGPKQKNVFIRGLLTSLFQYGHITTTSQRAKVLKSSANSFISKLIGKYKKYTDPKDARRECIRLVKATIFSEEVGKKIVNDLIEKYKNSDKTSFVHTYKVGFRKGDGSLKVLVKLM